MRRRTIAILILTTSIVVTLLPARVQAAEPVPGVDADLATLHVLRDYDTHKNSFVFGQETQCGLPLRVKPGERKTLLDVKGTGSLRHLWTTHARHRGSKGPAYLLEFYVDGETKPSIRGDIDSLVAAAARCEQPFVTLPGGVAPNRSYNIYLPIPFEKSLRVDLIATERIWNIFMQWDYRIRDDSLKGVRLTQQGEGKETKFVYTGVTKDHQPTKPIDPNTLEKKQFKITNGKPVVVEGPGIIRRLAVDAIPAGAKLRIRFDGEPTAAVDVDMADFFGPFQGVVLNNKQCYLPMPMKQKAEIEIIGLPDDKPVSLEVNVEPVDRFKENWAYFHAKSHRDPSSEGWRPHPVLSTGGRGHWVGMSLYETGSNHGGGDFALLDGTSKKPLLLHGINGEDYFSFAWHADGKNLPYSEAVGRGEGRVRFHLENPYVFHDSAEIAWSLLKDCKPRSVAYWYQDSPKDLTKTGKASHGLLWQVFGPVSVPTTKDGNTPDVSDSKKLFAKLPEAASLDAGKPATAEIHLLGHHTGQFDGWGKQYAIGPHLNLTYIYRQVIHRGSQAFLGSEPRAVMASTKLVSPEPQTVTLQISYDDPIEIWCNGRLVHTDMELREKLVTRDIKVKLRQGENRLLIKLVDTPNADYAWAGIVLRILDTEGRDISASLQDH